jgi:hypothetical protein
MPSPATHSRPRVFIGSSTEGLEVARALQHHLDDVAEVTVWKDGAFKQNEGNLEALLRMLDYYDFAVFAFTPDDKVESRGESRPCPRDNVLFEFGLFLGHLRQSRCFAVASDDRSLKVLSDLHGVTMARYCCSRSDGNLNAATASASSLIANQIRKLGARTADVHAAQITKKEHNIDSETQDEAAKKISERWGIEIPPHAVLGRLNQSKSAWFHNDRFTKAFPGVRGMEEIADPAQAIERLCALLKTPLAWIYEEADGGCLSELNPIWWWRGPANMHISDFRQHTPTVALMDGAELAIRRVVAVNAGVYWQSFVYVECNPQEPTGLYKSSEESMKWQVEQMGYADEEYAIYGTRLLTRAEYDDGAAMIGGVPQRIDTAELRIRYLTPYNFIIAPQSSPINVNAFDRQAEEILNGIIKGEKTVDHLVTAVLKLPQNSRDEY